MNGEVQHHQPEQSAASPQNEPRKKLELMASCFFYSGIPSVCKQVVSVETTRDIEWNTHTCPLGFQVFGKSPLFVLSSVCAEDFLCI